MSNPQELKPLEKSEREMREGNQISLEDLIHEIEKEKRAKAEMPKSTEPNTQTPNTTHHIISLLDPK